MTSTTGLSNVMSIYYDKLFLDRAKAELRFDFGADTKTIQPNSGKTVVFNRFTPLALATTPLSEGTNPTAVDMTSTQVSATLAEYGNSVSVSTLFKLTSLDENLAEHVDVMGTNAGETVDKLINNELSANATAQLAAASLTAIAATDVLSGALIRKAVRTLKTNKAQKFDGGVFRGIAQPATAYDLMVNTEWLDANRYTTSDAIKNGVIGKIAGVEFVESNNSSTESSTVTVYHNFVFGRHAYAQVSLAGQAGPRIIVKTPGANDTNNPLDMFSTVGWKVLFATKVLNANWIINIKTGATA